MPLMPDRVICDLCGDTVPPHAHYVVRIDVFADPSLPPVTTDELEEDGLRPDASQQPASSR